MTYIVHIGYDAVERIFFVESSDIPGLHVETETIEMLVDVVRDAAPDLLGKRAHGSTITFQREIELAAG